MRLLLLISILFCCGGGKSFICPIILNEILLLVLWFLYILFFTGCWVVHVLCCLQLERFLCPECSKVRCICTKHDKAPSPAKEDVLLRHQLTVQNHDLIKNDQNNSKRRQSESDVPSDPKASPLSEQNSLQSISERDMKQSQNERNNTSGANKSVLPKDMCINLFRNSSIRRSNVTPRPPPRSPTKGKPNVFF